MNIKKLFLLCSIICLHNASNNTQESQSGSLAWLYQEVKQSPNDAFNNPEIINNVRHYISLLVQQIELLEEKLKQSPNAIKELKKSTLLHTAQVMALGAATYWMFDHKEKMLIYLRANLGYYLGEFSNDLLFGTFLLSTCFLKIRQLEVIAKQQTYVENLNAELNACKQLLATLQLLQKQNFTDTINE